MPVRPRVRYCMCDLLESWLERAPPICAVLGRGRPPSGQQATLAVIDSFPDRQRRPHAAGTIDDQDRHDSVFCDTWSPRRCVAAWSTLTTVARSASSMPSNATASMLSLIHISEPTRPY